MAMKPPLSGVSTRVILIFALVSHLLNISEAIPVRDGIPGSEADIWQVAGVQKFYGPWSRVQKLNGEYADYNDYGAAVQDFQPGPEDEAVYEPEIADGEAGDFQSNYGEIEAVDSAVPFQTQSDDDQCVISNHDDGDQTEGGGGDPENHDLEGNVQWTSAAT